MFLNTYFFEDKTNSLSKLITLGKISDKNMTVQELMPVRHNSSLASWQHMQLVMIMYVVFSFFRCDGDYKLSFCIEIFHIETLNTRVRALLLMTFFDQL